MAAVPMIRLALVNVGCALRNFVSFSMFEAKVVMVGYIRELEASS